MIQRTLTYILVLTGLLAGVLFSSTQVHAQEQPTSEQKKIILFGRDDCTHCIDLKAYLAQAEFADQVEIVEYDISQPQSQELWNAFTAHYSLPKATPVLIIGDEILQGFDTAQTTGITISEKISKEYTFHSLDQLLAADPSSSTTSIDEACLDECVVTPQETQPFYLTLPFVGVVNIAAYSLPILTMVLGFVDGFNPCAMWVLVTFLVILLQLRDTKKMIIFAGTFILAEAIMYFLILSFWFTTFDFIGLDAYVTPLVGIVATAAGLYFLKKAWEGDTSCPIGSGEQKMKTASKIEKLVQSKITLLSIFGILAVAFSVNIVEFACSVGIPQTFTKILELKGYTFVSALPYTLLYTFFYMVDDFIVFAIALVSAQKLLNTQSYTKYSNAIGGLIMLSLGVIMLFAPELLMKL